MSTSELNIENAVGSRYSAASQEIESALCCPVNYDAKWLQVLPDELLQRDYGCGDPAQYVNVGDHVLDLGSGGGKICYIASQVVGADGRVIGVDINDDMLALARQYQSEITQRIGWDNVTFHKGHIQDLKLDLDQLQCYLQQSPADDTGSWLQAQQHAETLRQQSPMIADNSMDIVVSNCVLNLVKNEDRCDLFNEIHRVLKPGGRAVISDIVANRLVPQHLQDNPTLWSGCISGAFEQSAFADAFTNAGFTALEILLRQDEPWKIVETIEFRSITIRAWKPLPDDHTDEGQTAVYRGPWKEVVDDAGNILRRGQNTSITSGQMNQYQHPPLAGDLILLENTDQISTGQDLPIAESCQPGGDCC